MRRHALVATLGIALLAVTGCAAKPTEVIATPPPNVDLSKIPEGGSLGTGLQFLDGPSAVAEISLAARNAEWYSVTVSFQQRYTPTEEVPSIELHSYSGSAQGSSSEFNAELVVDGRSVQLYLRDGVLLGYGDLAALADLGFSPVESAPACLSAQQDAGQSLLALIVPDRIIETLLANPDNPVATVHTGALPEVAEGEAPVLEFGIAADSGVVGTMWVRAEGEPYPQRIVIADTTGDFLAEFGSWDDADTLSDPDDSAADC